MPRGFPAPWTAERIPDGYVVKDATGAMCYRNILVFESERGGES